MGGILGKRLALRREHTGDAAGDRMQMLAQDAARRVNALATRRTIAGIYTATITTTLNLTNTSWADVAGFLVTIPAVEAGDLLLMDFACLGSSSNANACQTRLAVVDGGTTFTNANTDGLTLGARGWYTNIVAVTPPIIGTWTVRKGGSLIVKVQNIAGAGPATHALNAAVDGNGGIPMLRVQHLKMH